MLNCSDAFFDLFVWFCWTASIQEPSIAEAKLNSERLPWRGGCSFLWAAAPSEHWFCHFLTTGFTIFWPHMLSAEWSRFSSCLTLALESTSFVLLISCAGNTTEHVLHHSPHSSGAEQSDAVPQSQGTHSLITGCRALRAPSLAQHILWDLDQKRAEDMVRGLGRELSP